MSITPLTVEPNSVTNPSGFSAEMDTHLSELNPMISQMNAVAVSMGSVAAGGTAIPYTFSTTTTDADPGAGILRLGSATQNAATVIRSDLVGSDGTTWTDLIDSFDDSTSTVKGQIILMNAADATKWLVFNLASIASPAGYRNITVTNVASSAASPFADGDSLLFKFTRTGDIGEAGPAGGLAAGTPVASTSGTSIDFTGIPSGTKRITVQFLGLSTTGGDRAIVQLGDSGGMETSGYTSGIQGIAGAAAATGTAGFFVGADGSNAYTIYGSLIMTIVDPAAFSWECFGVVGDTSGQHYMSTGGKALSAELTQIRITTTGGTQTFDAGKVNITYE